jgi:hypothetical protein
VTSQLPLSARHAVIGDPTYADAILDRLVHNAHRIELTGESLRRARGKNSKTAGPATQQWEQNLSANKRGGPGRDHPVLESGFVGIGTSAGAAAPLVLSFWCAIALSAHV